MWLARVYVTLKSGVLDPQGAAVARAINSLGYQSVQDVRVGKYMVLKLKDVTRAEAEKQLQEICRRLLANPVIEDYRFELMESDEA